MILLVFSAGFLAYGLTQTRRHSEVPEDWLIAACDVGQGDSAAIRTGAHSAIVVDVGPKDRKTGGEGVDACLKKLRVSKVDLLVLSHFHDDHIGDLQAALNGREVTQALVSPIMQPEAEYQRTMRTFDGAGVPVTKAADGMTGEAGCEEFAYCVRYEVVSVWDDKGVDGALFDGGRAVKAAGSKTGGEDDRENDGSVAMLFNVNGVSYFTAGDLELSGSAGAYAVLNKRGQPPVDVVKANHHGSKTQNQQLLNLLRPKVALYMVGKNNYGHPNPQTLEAFAKLGAMNLRTDAGSIAGVFLEDGELMAFGGE